MEEKQNQKFKDDFETVLKNEWEFRKWAHLLIHSFIKSVLSTYSVSKFWRNTDESNVALKKLTF